MRTVLIALSLSLSGCGEPDAEAICEEQTSCPDLEYINCQPVVPEETAPYCTSECVDYLEDECGLQVVW